MSVTLAKGHFCATEMGVVSFIGRQPWGTWSWQNTVISFFDFMVSSMVLSHRSFSTSIYFMVIFNNNKMFDKTRLRCSFCSVIVG